MSNIIATDASSYPQTPEELARWRPTGVKNLTPGLVERGKIKIGMKGAARTSGSGSTFQMPKKLDHFLVTSMDRGNDNNYLIDQRIMEMLGSNPTEIPVKLVYDDPELNFPTRYAMYNGKTLQCTGDGNIAKWRDPNQPGGYMQVICPCHRQDPAYQGKDKCKINGTLSVIIEGADVVGGVWKFRTTSYNSVVGILSSLAMIQRISGGALAGIPLVMKVSPKSVADPVKGSQQTIYVVSLEYRGTVESLRDAGYQTLIQQQKHGVRIEQIENRARALLSVMPDQMEVEADDIIPEYYPEQQEGYNEAVKQERVVEAGKQSAERTSFISRNPSSAPRQEQQIDDVIEHEPEPQQQPQENANARHQASQEPQQQSGNDEVNVF